MRQVIAIVSQKGGVGKTATTVNLGACLSAIKRKVLMIGMDPQGGLGKCFGIEPSDGHPGLLDVLRDGTPTSEVIYPVHPRLPRLDMVPANVKSSSEESLFQDIIGNNLGLLVHVLEQVKPKYDFIFIDCPSRLDSPTQAALTVADSYLVPVQCEYASMGTVGRVLRAALEVKRMANMNLGIFGFLLTMADKRARFTIKVVQEVRRYLKDKVFRTIVPRDPSLAEVPDRQAPVIVYDIESPGAKAYIRLAREILREQDSSAGRRK